MPAIDRLTLARLLPVQVRSLTQSTLGPQQQTDSNMERTAEEGPHAMGKLHADSSFL